MEKGSASPWLSVHVTKVEKCLWYFERDVIAVIVMGDWAHFLFSAAQKQLT